MLDAEEEEAEEEAELEGLEECELEGVALDEDGLAELECALEDCTEDELDLELAAVLEAADVDDAGGANVSVMNAGTTRPAMVVSPSTTVTDGFASSATSCVAGTALPAAWATSLPDRLKLG